MEVYVKKERQEVLGFYLRPDVQAVIADYEQKLAEIYGDVVGVTDPIDRDIKRMNIDEYTQSFGEVAELVPTVLDRRDLELIFDTIINERVDIAGSVPFTTVQDQALTRNAGTLSYEEFKKSIVRIASICNVQTRKAKMDVQEMLEENQRLMDGQGLEEPDEWDEHGNPVKFKTIVNLKKKSNSQTQNAYRAMILNPPKEAVAPPPKLYDISLLK